VRTLKIYQAESAGMNGAREGQGKAAHSALEGERTLQKKKFQPAARLGQAMT
jgi:hypothetical protein